MTISDVVAGLKKRLLDTGNALAPTLRGIGNTFNTGVSNIQGNIQAISNPQTSRQWFSGFQPTYEKIQNVSKAIPFVKMMPTPYQVAQEQKTVQKIAPFVPFLPKVVTPQQTGKTLNSIKSNVGGFVKGIGTPYEQQQANIAKDINRPMNFGEMAGRAIAGGGLTPLSPSPFFQGAVRMVKEIAPTNKLIEERERNAEDFIKNTPFLKNNPNLAETYRKSQNMLTMGVLTGLAGESKNFSKVDLKKAFHKGDVESMKEFSAKVEMMGNKANKANMGNIGVEADAIVKKYFGNKFRTLPNTQIKQLFDYALAKVENMTGGDALVVKPKGFTLPLGLQAQESEGLAQQALRTRNAESTIKESSETIQNLKRQLDSMPKNASGRKYLNNRIKTEQSIINIMQKRLDTQATKEAVQPPQGGVDLMKEAKKYKSAEEFILPKEVSTYEEAKKIGAKRISPDRIAHHQLTPDEGIAALVNKQKVRTESNAKSWENAASKIDSLVAKYGDSIPARTEKNIQKYPGLVDDYRTYYELKQYAWKPKDLKDISSQFKIRANGTRARITPETEAKMFESAKKDYIELIKKDISHGYKFPDEVLNYDKSFRTAVDSRARYEKGLYTSFSADDHRIVFDDTNRIAAGMKRQDGSNLLPNQKEEIINGVLQTEDALGIDLNKLSKDERWVYAHLNGKNPFLTRDAAGLYRKGDGYVSVSVGGTEAFDVIINGEKVRKRVNTTVAHELGHALDHSIKGDLIDTHTFWMLKDSFKPIEFMGRGDKYWKSKSEVSARAIEQYVAVKNGNTNLFDREGYWNRDTFERIIKPIIEKSINEKFSGYKKTFTSIPSKLFLKTPQTHSTKGMVEPQIDKKLPQPSTPQGGETLYHATTKTFDKLERQTKAGVEKTATKQPLFFAQDELTARSFTKGAKGERVIAVKLKPDAKIWDFDDFNSDSSKGFTDFEEYLIKKGINPEDAYNHAKGILKGNWDSIESSNFQNYLESKGYDGFKVIENGKVNTGILNTDAIIQSQPSTPQGGVGMKTPAEPRSVNDPIYDDMFKIFAQGEVEKKQMVDYYNNLVKQHQQGKLSRDEVANLFNKKYPKPSTPQGGVGYSKKLLDKQGIAYTPQQETNKKLPNILYSTKKADETFVPSGLRRKRPEVEDDFIRGLEMDQKRNIQTIQPKQKVVRIKNDKQSGYAAQHAVDQGQADTSFADWVRQRRATKVEGDIKGKTFSDLDTKGIKGIFEFQTGEKTGRLADVKKYFDSKRTEVIKAGKNLNYKRDYLPQLWANSKEEVEQKLGRRLSQSASFSLESVIKNYEEGIKLGLTPRYSKVSELVSWYERSANKLIADRNYFQTLADGGFIRTKPLDGWVSLKPDNFPSVKVQFDSPKGGNTEYSGVYYAPRDLAEKINNYLSNPELGTFGERALASVANFISGAKNRMLSFGIPGTGINFHAFNITARSFLEGGPKGGLKTLYWMVNPKAAGQVVEQKMSMIPDAIRSGVKLSTEMESGIESTKLFSKLGKVWNELFEKPFFDKVLTARKIESWENVWRNFAKSMPEKEAKTKAAEFVNTLYGGIDWEAMGRSRNMQNLFRTIALTPDWLESNIRLGGGMVKSWLNPRNPAGQAYRKATALLVGALASANVINKISSGHNMWENDNGHEFEIEAGYTQDGQKRYIRPFGTSVDYARLPFEIIKGIANGDPSVIGQRIRNRLSTGLQPVMSLVTNTDWAGNPLFGRTKYGQEMTPMQNLSGAYNLAAPVVGVPAFLGRAADYATGKTGAEQALLQGFELPVRYSGGAYSSSQKQIKPLIEGLSGKEKYDTYKELKGQKKFSDNQMGLIQAGQQTFRDIIAKRQENEVLNKAKEQMKQSGGDSMNIGDKVLIKQANGDIKTIDLSFQPKEPQLTQQTELNKKLISKYNSEITRKTNDIVSLFEAGKISEVEAEKQLSELITKKTKYAKAKKVSVKPIRSGRVSLKAPKLAKIKIKAPSKPQIKLLKTKKSKVNLVFKPKKSKKLA